MRADPEFYEREYNARAAVPEHPSILARWAERGEAARRSWPSARLDLRYGDHPRQRLDWFPAERAGGPLHVFIHGGYWRSLTQREFGWVAQPWLARGVNVALVDYALAPEVNLETIVRHNLAALVHLWDNADDLGFERDRIVVSGHSAGGHLCAMMLAAHWPSVRPGLPADLVKAGVAISGLFELEPFRLMPSFQVDLKLTPESVAMLSPARMRPDPDLPLVLAVGQAESSEFHRQAALLKAARSPSSVREVSLPGRNHFTACDALAEPGHALFAATHELLLG